AATRSSEGARLGVVLSVGLLIAGGVGSAFVSDWFVHALEPTIEKLHISQAFAGLVIVAIAGNAVEHAAGIVLAIRGRSDLAIAVVKSSVAQIAAFMYPLLVLVSLLTATHLTFALAPIYVASLLATAILIWQITSDGEATAFEGAALIAVFIAIATVAAFEHQPPATAPPTLRLRKKTFRAATGERACQRARPVHRPASAGRSASTPSTATT